jgi:prolyl oligopeptidase
MRETTSLVALVSVILVTSFAVRLSSSEEKLQYPKTLETTRTDNYFGTVVPDPFRWLEDDNSPQTARWVEEQNKLTFAYLDKIPYRMQVKDRLMRLYNYPKFGTPMRRGEYFFYSRNEGLQNQPVFYIQKGLDGAPEVLIDPNKFSSDGTSRLTVFALSRDGRYAGYGISQAGSDWQEFRVMEIASRQALPDVLKWIKFSGIAWQGDGFYYSRCDEPAKGKELSSVNEGSKIYYHKLHTPQSADERIYEDREHPQRFNEVDTTEDERFVILSAVEGSTGKKGNALFYRDNSAADKSFKPVVADITDDTYGVVDNVGSKLLVSTNSKAPNGRLFLFDPASPGEKDWQDILPEKPEPLESVSSAGGRLFATYLKDVTTRAYVFGLDGKPENEIALPGPGTAAGFDGLRDDKFVFYTFTSFNFPPTIFRYDIATQLTSVFRSPEIPGFKPSDYETRQVFYTSRDGTRVPMFLVHRKGLALDGRNPTLLYGYGGFNISTSPAFSSLRLALLEQGFVYASANMRGGGEYGESWHEAGTKLKKQNVFDDFIAAAEWLIKSGYTEPARLAILGGSNGGLLVGAVINQRPDLFKVAVPQVGVMDMLRFHKFTIGREWISDYGSSDNEQEFRYLYAYSPLHNIKVGVKYPATLITTADHDDRVVPAHSFKYAATLQKKAAPGNPVLIRIEAKSGHGSSSTTKMIELTADIYSFIFHNLGVTPKY